ncbi:hypothetical protein O2W14_08660 [Modestobacter sp. VKM Ac-2986]|uniref:hypothetical protein n=1 Tax=Modestobacter sp. VKM Ac-2986 TaxID=3004140 RepID=UPI0022AB483B|nr:hypothetical protein [Modestobacter sp. VKM Ac-2986]MCZ2828900.1 hypothetical protein [Modestobacter sp. VKM Ac-2986]
MRTSVRGSVSGGVVAAGAAVLLTACGGQPVGGAAGPVQVSEAAATGTASPATASASPATGTADDLAAGLLPASAFGPDAEVVALPEDAPGWWSGHDGWDHEGWDGHGWGHGGRGHGGWGEGGWWGHGDGAEDLPEGTGVEPAACADVLSALPELPDEEPEVAGQVATTDQLRTFQVLADGPALEGLQLPVDQLLENCAQVTVTGPWGMTATFSVTELDAADRGAATTALSVAVTSPAGSRSGLVGVVTQGSRAMVLAQTSEDGAEPDAGAFTALLDQAADAASFD